MKLPDLSKPPPALDPTIVYRENMIEADVESLERMRQGAGFCVLRRRVGACRRRPISHACTTSAPAPQLEIGFAAGAESHSMQQVVLIGADLDIDMGTVTVLMDVH
jgi:hypothetical protein